MNFRFFGDSWFWTWVPNHYTDDPNKPFMSNSMNRHGEYQHGISVMKIMLQALGHSVETFCQPGFSFNQTCTRIDNCREFLPSNRQPEVWVIWASSDLRAAHHLYKSQKPDWDLTDKNKFLQQYNDYMLWSLNWVNRRALEDVTYLFVGGQQNLPKKDVWDRVTDLKPNMHLLSECILGTLMRTYQNSGFNDLGRFYLEEEFVKLVDSQPKDANLDLELIDMFAQHRRQTSGQDSNFQHISTRLMWPDTGHLGFNGHVMFVDYLLNWCEVNNLI